MFVNWHLAKSDISNSSISLWFITFTINAKHTFALRHVAYYSFLIIDPFSIQYLGLQFRMPKCFGCDISVVWWVVLDFSKDRIVFLFLLHRLNPTMKTVWSFGKFGKPSPCNTTACPRRPSSIIAVGYWNLGSAGISCLKAYNRELKDNDRTAVGLGDRTVLVLPVGRTVLVCQVILP